MAKNRKAQLLRSEEILKQREENFNNNPSEESITKLDEAMGVSMTHYMITLFRGKIIRSRANWYEQGEKNSKYV